MERKDFDRLLARAAVEPLPHRARMLADQLREQATASWMDAELDGRSRELCDRSGLRWPSVASRPLRIGETWLLLAAGTGGHVVRLLSEAHGVTSGLEVAVGVRTALRGLRTAAAGAHRHLPSEAASRRLGIVGGMNDAGIVGHSLGLSSAVVTLSVATGKAPLSDVAGTATVDAEGRLGPVRHLAEKVSALRRQWPSVRKVVVADGQPVPDFDRSVAIIHASSLSSACSAFGLSLDDLPACAIEDRISTLANLRSEHSNAHDSAQWFALSARAWETARALGAEPRCLRDAGEALLLAALFASHSGDNQQALEILEGVHEDQLGPYPALQARKLIYRAASSIDASPIEAAETARRAVDICETLAAGDRAELLGQALGTHGRALLHRGDIAEARPLLEKALAHHRQHAHGEWPRSACYLATCLRRGGHPKDALVVAQEALAETERSSSWRIAQTTAIYLRLERGRILADLGRLEDALQDFESVQRSQDNAAAYPRLGAHRSVVEVLVRLGRSTEATSHLRTCLEVALGRGSDTLRRVGAVAAGEALLRNDALLPREELEAAWQAGFSSTDDVERVVRSWVY